MVPTPSSHVTESRSSHLRDLVPTPSSHVAESRSSHLRDLVTPESTGPVNRDLRDRYCLRDHPSSPNPCPVPYPLPCFPPTTGWVVGSRRSPVGSPGRRRGRRPLLT